QLVEQVEAGERNLPIGKPLSNTKSYVLDEYMRPVPFGVSGELYIGGDGIARGYWERAEQTAEKFVPDPFSEQVGARLYRTGDIARYRSTGELEFIGRKDQQVKLRGIRIELEEIDSVLGACPGVQACKTIVRAEEELLVAYIAVEGAAVSESEVRSFLKDRLPSYMVPSFFVLLDALPLTPNGKIDVRALPAPELIHRENEGSYSAPITTSEQKLCDIWSNVLEVETVGVDDNFFELGGHSLLVILLISQVREVFGVEIPVNSIFDKPTVKELAREIAIQVQAHDGPAAATRLQCVSREEPLALSFAQQQLWFIDQMEPGSVFYNVPMPKRLLGTLNVEALERALNDLVRRHESLRTTFPVHKGEPLQVIAAAGEWRLEKVDLRALPRAEREAVVQELAGREWHEGFDLSTG